MNGPYDDIINLPHHVSPSRPQMPMTARAAQFASFAALVGHDSAVRETARLTEERIELDETALEVLNMKLSMLAGQIAGHTEVSIIYFVPDARKKGGSYVTATGVIKKIDTYNKAIIFEDGRIILIDDILEIYCGIFED